jgi:F0F1-type ATP synthase gamma subunit
MANIKDLKKKIKSTKGTFKITKAMKLRNSKGVVKSVAVGTYSADVNANTKKKITLRLNNDANEKFEFNEINKHHNKI